VSQSVRYSIAKKNDYWITTLKRRTYLLQFCQFTHENILANIFLRHSGCYFQRLQLRVGCVQGLVLLCTNSYWIHSFLNTRYMTAHELTPRDCSACWQCPRTEVTWRCAVLADSAHELKSRDSVQCLLTVPMNWSHVTVCSACWQCPRTEVTWQCAVPADSAHELKSRDSVQCLLTVPTNWSHVTVCSACWQCPRTEVTWQCAVPADSAHELKSRDSVQCLLTVPMNWSHVTVCCPLVNIGLKLRPFTLSSHHSVTPHLVEILLTLLLVPYFNKLQFPTFYFPTHNLT